MLKRHKNDECKNKSCSSMWFIMQSKNQVKQRANAFWQVILPFKEKFSRLGVSRVKPANLSERNFYKASLSTPESTFNYNAESKNSIPQHYKIRSNPITLHIQWCTFHHFTLTTQAHRDNDKLINFLYLWFHSSIQAIIINSSYHRYK